MAAGEFSSINVSGEDFLNNQLDLSNITSNIVLFLRGYAYDPLKKAITNKYDVTIWDEEKKEYRLAEKLRNPLLNELGIQDITKNLNFRIQNSLAISNLTKEDVKTIRLAVVDVIWTALAYNWKEYGLSGVDKVQDIIYAIDDNLLCFYSKTETGWVAKLLAKLINRKEVINNNNTTQEIQKPQGIFGKRGGNI